MAFRSLPDHALQLLKGDEDGGTPAVDATIIDAAFRRASACMAITDDSGNYLEVNDALCTFLGYSAAELCARSFREVTAPEDLTEGAYAMEGLVKGRTDEFWLEKRYQTATGELVWARTTGTAIKDASTGQMHVIVQIEDLTTRRAVEAALARRTSYDELTGLANRRLFYERLQAALMLSPRSVRGLALFVVNLDRFHQVNSGLGHTAGDAILREAGHRLTAIVRGDDTVSRLGGDEYAVLALGMHDPLDAVALAIDIRDNLERPYWADGNSVYVSARVGVVTNVNSVDGETLVQMAEAATEQAKSLSGGWAMHADGANATSRDEFGFVGDLRLAITEETINVAYQPIVDGSGTLHHFEALARWNHPERGAVPPDQFIVLAEQNGLIAALTTLVMTKAVQQTARWRAAGLPASVAVNLSGKLLTEPDLADRVSAILEKSNLPADALTLEITETVLAGDSTPVVLASLDTLRQTGIRISIDDFGTGYSSLSYLKQLPVDELKIDRSFILDLETDDRTERIVRSIIDLAHSIGLKVVAEGVEDGGVADRLLRLGIDYLQGYAIARPTVAAATTEWLKAKSVAVTAKEERTRARPPLSVLVVDGSPADRTALRKRLRANKHRVTQAKNCESALQVFARRMPDVVILDHMMPHLNGVEIAPRLREAGYVGPIVLFNGSLPDTVPTARFPLDVWPVSIEDESLLVDLIEGYAVHTAATRLANA